MSLSFSSFCFGAGANAVLAKSLPGVVVKGLMAVLVKGLEGFLAFLAAEIKVGAFLRRTQAAGRSN